MKNAIFICSLLIASFFGCSTFSLGSSENSAWSMAGGEQPKGAVRIISVSVDKSGEWGSLEKEISAMLPLLFLEESYLVVPSREAADFSAEVTVREREYLSGWRTRRSLSVELRLWDTGNEGPLPLSAGRALYQGKRSLASSQTLSDMLRKAVKNAIGGLPGRGRQ